MEINCNVVNDLLPLYAEDMVSAETRALVEGHLEGCAACRGRLAALKAGAPVAADTDAAPIRRISRAVKRRRAAAAVLAACLVLTLAAVVVGRLSEPVYDSYGDIGVTVDEMGDGTLRVLLECSVEHFDTWEGEDPDGGTAYVIAVWRTRWSELTSGAAAAGEAGTVISIDHPVRYISMISPGGFDRVVWGDAPSMLTASLPRLVLNYYFLLSLIAAAVFGALLLILIKRPKGRRVAALLAAAPLCYAAASLALKGLNAVSYSAGRDLLFILVAAAGLYGVCVSAAYIIRDRRAGRA